MRKLLLAILLACAPASALAVSIGADDVLIDVTGDGNNDKTLQQAQDDGDLAAGGGASTGEPYILYQASPTLTNEAVLDDFAAFVSLLGITGTCDSTTFLRGDGVCEEGSLGGGGATFLGHSDTPSAYTALNFLRVNAAGDAVEQITTATALTALGAAASSHTHAGSDLTGQFVDEVADVDTTLIQRRVSASCPAGQSIRVIAQDGTVTCEVDDTTAAATGYTSITDGSGTATQTANESIGILAGTGISSVSCVDSTNDECTINAAMTSVFGRTGAVNAATSDYDAVQVDNTPAGGIAATNVQAAIDELDTEKVGTADSAGGDATGAFGALDVLDADCVDEDDDGNCEVVANVAGGTGLCDASETLCVCFNPDDDATTTDNFCVGGSGGIYGRDANLDDVANLLVLKANDAAVATSLPNPITCANSGTAGKFTILDIDRTSNLDFIGCEGTTPVIDFSAPPTGDNVSVNGAGVVDPDLTSTGSDLTLVNAGDVITFLLKADSVGADELASTAIQAGDIEAGDLPADGYASTYVNVAEAPAVGDITGSFSAGLDFTADMATQAELDDLVKRLSASNEPCLALQVDEANGREFVMCDRYLHDDAGNNDYCTTGTTVDTADACDLTDGVAGDANIQAVFTAWRTLSGEQWEHVKFYWLDSANSGDTSQGAEFNHFVTKAALIMKAMHDDQGGVLNPDAFGSELTLTLNVGGRTLNVFHDDGIRISDKWEPDACLDSTGVGLDHLDPNRFDASHDVGCVGSSIDVELVGNLTIYGNSNPDVDACATNCSVGPTSIILTDRQGGDATVTEGSPEVTLVDDATYDGANDINAGGLICFGDDGDADNADGAVNTGRDCYHVAYSDPVTDVIDLDRPYEDTDGTITDWAYYDAYLFWVDTDDFRISEGVVHVFYGANRRWTGIASGAGDRDIPMTFTRISGKHVDVSGILSDAEPSHPSDVEIMMFSNGAQGVDGSRADVDVLLPRRIRSGPPPGTAVQEETTREALLAGAGAHIKCLSNACRLIDPIVTSANWTRALFIGNRSGYHRLDMSAGDDFPQLAWFPNGTRNATIKVNREHDDDVDNVDWIDIDAPCGTNQECDDSGSEISTDHHSLRIEGDLINFGADAETTGRTFLDNDLQNAHIHIEAKVRGVNTLFDVVDDIDSMISGFVEVDDVATTWQGGAPSLTRTGFSLNGIWQGSLSADSVGSAELDPTLSFTTSGSLGSEVGLQTLASASDTLVVGETRGTMHLANFAGTTTYTLPAVSACSGSDGCNLCVYALQAQTVTIDPNASDRIILNGTAQADGESIDSAGAAGNFICLINDSADGWLSLGRSGSWTNGG